MNSTKIAEKFFECSIPPQSLNRGWTHNSGQLYHCKIELIRDIDNYIYDYNYDKLIFMYFWLICLSYILYINNFNSIIYMMKKMYNYSLYLVGYKQHNKMHILENKINLFEDTIKDLNNTLNKFTIDLNKDLNEYIDVIDKKIVILENSYTSKSLFEPD